MKVIVEASTVELGRGDGEGRGIMDDIPDWSLWISVLLFYLHWWDLRCGLSNPIAKCSLVRRVGAVQHSDAMILMDHNVDDRLTPRRPLRILKVGDSVADNKPLL